jgi:nitrate/nitrite transport system substrate-binding protein
VFCVTRKFAEANPNTTRSIVRALIRAGRWLDASMDNRRQLAAMLAHKDYIGAAPEIIAESITGTLVYGVAADGSLDRRPEPQFNVFYKRYASFPLTSHGVWCLTQMRRWGMISEDKPDAWYQETAAKVFRADIYRAAFDSLKAEGLVQADELPAQDALSYPAESFIDRIPFDPAQPNDYIKRFTLRKP